MTAAAIPTFTKNFRENGNPRLLKNSLSRSLRGMLAIEIFTSAIEIFALITNYFLKLSTVYTQAVLKCLYQLNIIV
jgi:hypothetical protein